ncbi:hypothetical protein [Phenylobacterium sp.]|uniref:hypothetical protein n=1 Tax=Phenylobacterium sp. TaxID=1871053 RepID=UPI0030F36FF5
MPTTHAAQILWVAIIAACAFGLLKGGPAERIGAGMTLLISVAFIIVNELVPEVGRPVPHLVLDGVLALAFLGLAVRYASLWIGAVMLLQGVQFSLHAYFFVTKLTPGVTYAIVNNLVTWATLLGIVLGTFAYVRHSRASAVTPSV